MLPNLCETIEGNGSVESLSIQLWGTHDLQEKKCGLLHWNPAGLCLRLHKGQKRNTTLSPIIV